MNLLNLMNLLKISTILLSLFCVEILVSASTSSFRFVELNEPTSPIIRKRKIGDDQNPVGFPDKMTPEYLRTRGLEFNQAVLDEDDTFDIHHRALCRQIKRLAMKGISFYDDRIIPEDALNSYALEKFLNEFIDYYSEILITETVEEESKYLQAVIDLLSQK